MEFKMKSRTKQTMKKTLMNPQILKRKRMVVMKASKTFMALNGKRIKIRMKRPYPKYPKMYKNSMEMLPYLILNI